MTLEIITTEKVTIDAETVKTLQKLHYELQDISYNLVNEINSIEELIPAISNFLNDEQIVTE